MKALHHWSKKNILGIKMLIFFYTEVETYVLGAQRKRLNETFLLSIQIYVLVEI